MKNIILALIFIPGIALANVSQTINLISDQDLSWSKNNNPYIISDEERELLKKAMKDYFENEQNINFIDGRWWCQMKPTTRGCK